MRIFRFLSTICMLCWLCIFHSHHFAYTNHSTWHSSALKQNNESSNYGFLSQNSIPVGQRLAYRFTWEQQTHDRFASTIQIADQLRNVESEIEGEVVFESYHHEHKSQIVAVRIERLEPLHTESSNTWMQSMIRDVVGPSAYLVLHSNGAIESIRFPQHTSTVFQNFISRLIGIISHSRNEDLVGSSKNWSNRERTSFGVAHSLYEPKGAHEWFRTRSEYVEIDAIPPDTNLDSYTQEISSGALFTFRNDGLLNTFSDSEHILLRDPSGQIALDLLHNFTFRLHEHPSKLTSKIPSDLDRYEVRAPWQIKLNEQAERAAIEDRLEGLNATTLIERIRNVAVLKQIPNQVQFFNRAIGLIKLQPALSQTFVPLVHEPNMTYEGRAFALDILVGAGNDVAQEALLTILRDAKTKLLPEYVMLYQRISLVRSPSDRLVDFAIEQFEQNHNNEAQDEASKNIRMTSIYALGSVIGHMNETFRNAQATQFVMRLHQKLDDAKTIDDVVAYIMALGNAGLSVSETLLLQFSTHTEAQVRYASINALRKFNTALTRSKLVNILVSPSTYLVQREALRSLLLMTPKREDIQQISQAILSEKVHRDLYGELIPLFRKGFAPLADVSDALDAMFERSAEHDDDVQDRIDTLRAELSQK